MASPSFDRATSTSGADLSKLEGKSGVTGDGMTDIRGNHLISHDIKNGDQYSVTFTMPGMALIQQGCGYSGNYPLFQGTLCFIVVVAACGPRSEEGHVRSNPRLTS